MLCAYGKEDGRSSTILKYRNLREISGEMNNNEGALIYISVRTNSKFLNEPNTKYQFDSTQRSPARDINELYSAVVATTSCVRNL